MLREQQSAKLDMGAERCLSMVLAGEVPPPARLVWFRSVDGEKLRLEVVWDPDVGHAFMQLPGAEGTRAVPLDPWLAGELDGFIATYGVQVTEPAGTVLARLLAERRAAADAVRRSRADHADPIPEVAAVLGGSLAPFQWAGVRYALDARQMFLADEQGLGKTVEALATLEADDAYPAIVVCPASMKLGWQREAAKWLPHRTVAVDRGALRRAAPRRDHDPQLRDRRGPPRSPSAARARARSSSTSRITARTHAPSARRRSAGSRRPVQPDGLRLALTGTPVLNHAEELIAQLRVIGRLEDFGSGSSFSQQFGRALSEERLHWHLRRRCFVRRVKADVLPQLPEKRQVVVPVALTNEAEYRLAERDVVEWLRSQPLDLSELESKIAATLRAERLAQLGTLQRLAARGKLAAAVAWIDDFLESGEPLVVFARHVEVHQAVLARFPTRCTWSAKRLARGARGVDRRLPGARRPAADRLRHPRRGPGDHADPRVERRLPRARVDAGHARPGRGPLPPHRSARCRHGVVPAGRQHDRRDDGAADPEQARARLGGDRRTDGRRRWAGRSGHSRAARWQALCTLACSR